MKRSVHHNPHIPHPTTNLFEFQVRAKDSVKKIVVTFPSNAAQRGNFWDFSMTSRIVQPAVSIVRKLLSSFVRRDDGTIAIIFAIGLSALLGTVGLAIDYGQFIRAKQATQSALDAAVLAATSYSVENTAAREERFKDVFNATLKSGIKDPESLTFTFSQADGGKGVAKIKLQTSFLSVLGISSAQAEITSIARTNKLDIEIALALDISGSMLFGDMGGGSRLDALKASVYKLMDTINATKSPSQTVKYSVIPFNMAVNIGTDHSAIVEGASNSLFSGSPWAGCVLERPNGYHAKDTFNSTAADGSGKWPAYVWPPAPNSGSSSCLNPSNGTNKGYQSVEPAPLGKNPWVRGPNYNCPRFPIVRLTDSDSTVRSAINGLAAYGNTGTVIGPAVGWALRALSPSGPFRDGAQFSAQTRKIIIAVTDGEMVTDGSSCSGAVNSSEAYSFDPVSVGLQGRKLTTAPTNDSFTPYGYLADSDPYNKGVYSGQDADKELDRLSIEACAEAKSRATGAGAIEIFTIAASAGAGPGTRAQTVLAKCASSSGNFIYAADATALEAAFKKIGEQALGLRLTN